MLEAGIIQLVEELEWIILMLVLDKKTGKNRICIDLRKLNDAILYDLFPMPFIDEAMEGVGR